MGQPEVKDVKTNSDIAQRKAALKLCMQWQRIDCRVLLNLLSCVAVVVAAAAIAVNTNTVFHTEYIG